MKMKFNLTIALLFVLSSMTGFAQVRKTTLDMPEFSGVHMSLSGKVFVKQGSKTEVILETTDEIREGLDIYVRGDILKIGSKSGWSWRGWSRSDKLVVYVTVKDIDEIKVSGSGSVVSENLLKANRLDLAVSGSGRINIKTEADELDSSISGSGSIVVGGKSKYNEVSISGSGSLKAEDLVSEEYDVRISGSGNCQINVSKKIDARVSGSGKVYYKGDPSYVNANVSGSGKVRKM